ncbi:ABC transporter ATP-binding protein [Bordetella avium]|uniref:ABC transporter ATP-binding protein n=1 Tax=Bordetella avium TaxID=521 RepID=UPI000E0C2B31|nr:dipeptide ABC transporter ATP-binding protein [Bordetella avium]AZY53234.1 ABC transporter ATP-binding protein [Bordetella avium]RIQ13144.1 dipeptide ABC transporter ATP-binding protein [Bordetella avium]RIQ37710.1 dipeptide ABC transporter ATP-binding protein [Bordetella avium]RIQ42166.1 dipeptide ABC transporter ATP-binding protein [Bordetella avium]RIQ42611.1 dipeptide ABC transporter ATP-binding protein [Bordetella avium]
MTLLNVQDLDVAIEADDRLAHVVKRLSFAIERGQTFALVGESGSGKSMTALALLRLLPDAGRIVGGQVNLGDQDLNTLTERQMRGVRGGRIGIIFQEPSTSLNPVMRVGEQIIETLTAHTRLRGAMARRRAIEWLARVGIPEAERRVDDYPFQFSGGQKQRVMIAIALAAEPLLLIADEPTTALDVTVQAQVLELLADIQREMGMAVLLITHDLAIVRQTAHHVALMRGGEIVESADACSFFSAPRHAYARELFDAVPTFEKRGRPLSAKSAPAAVAPRRAAEVVLEVKDLCVHYPVRSGFLQKSWSKAVNGVSFELRAGETLALLGESGCGKTTTGKALLRLVERASVSGSALLNGQNLLTAGRRSMQALRRDIQIVFQDPYASLDPRMRIGDILDEGVASLHPQMPAEARRARAEDLLCRVGLPADTSRRYPHEFSGGQRQRIAIARALAVEPKVLICDEPTSALDVSVQAQILDLFQELQRDLGIAYLFITHNFGVVEYLADRIAVMAEGKIVEVGDAAEVLQRPAHALTRRLLKAVPRLAFGA